MNIVIEKPTREDAEAMLEYLKRIGGETDNLTFGAEGVSCAIEEEAAQIERAASSRDEVMFVAKDKGIIVGDVSLSRLPRRMRHRGDLGIAVVKEYWGCGIGSSLLGKVIEFAKENDFDVIELQVRSDNAAAIHLYEKFGFQKFGTHESFFKMGRNEIPFDYMYLKIR